MRHVWCDRSQDLRADPHPSVPSLVCYCILLPNYWPAAYAAQARNLTDPAIGKCIIKPSAATPKKSRSKSAHRPRETKKGAPRTARRRRGNNGRAHEAKPVTQTSHGPPAPDRLLHLDAGQERPEFDRAVFNSIHDAGGSPWSSVRDWGAAVPSRHRRDSFPSDEVVGGFFFDFEVIRTASRDAALDASTRRSSRRCRSRLMWIRR